MTARDDIRDWLWRAKVKGATHMIVVCDTFDHSDYPVYVLPGQNVRKTAAEFDGKNMQRIMEVYDMSMDIDAQLAERRAFHY